MDPATLVGVTQLFSLATNLYQQFTSGTITAEQAGQQFAAACADVQKAIANFEAAKPANG